MPSKESLYGMFLVHKFWTVFHHDFIDCFIPFVVAPLRDRRTRSLREIKDAIKNEFHFDIPTHPLAAILTRARKRGALTIQHSHYAINPENAHKYDLASTATAQQRILEGVLAKLNEFIKTNCTTEFSIADIETGFLDFLSAHEKEILDGFGNVLVMQEVKQRKVLKYFISQFIASAHKSDQILYSTIVQISIGQMLSSALFNVHDEQGLEKFRGNLTNLKVFFDSRFLIRLLGLEGHAHRASAQELVSSLRALSAECCLCKITMDELSRILWYSSDSFKGVSDSYKASKLRLQQFGVDESELDIIISDIEGRLREEQIFYKEKIYDNYTTSYQIDQNAIYDVVVQTYKRNNPSFSESTEKERIERDCAVIAEVYQARNLQTPSSLVNAKAIFVTTNTGLPQATRIFDDTISNRGKSVISPAVTDTFIGTIIWIQNPSRVDAIGSKRLIALVNAALLPEAHCIEKYIGFVEQLRRENRISHGAYTLAVAHRVAVNVLEDYTCGCSDSLEISTVEDIVQQIEQRIKADEIAKTESERALKEDAISQKKIFEDKYDKTEKQLKTSIDHVQKQAQLLIAPILYLFRGIFFLIIIAGLLVTIIQWKHWSGYLCLLLVAMFTFFNLKSGWTIDGFFKKMSISLSNKIAHFFTHSDARSSK